MLLLLVLQVLQVVQIEHCPGGEPALHCSLSSSQLICLPEQWASQLEEGKCSEQSFVQYSAAQLHHSAHRARCRKQGSWIGWSDGQPVCWLVGACPSLSCSLSDQQCWSTSWDANLQRAIECTQSVTCHKRVTLNLLLILL